MTNEVMVSVIVPIYNVENYLEQCLNSIVNQQTEYKIQVILVNDGSTDSSLEIAKKYAKENDFVLISQENAGLSAARNKGMEYANGKYVLFLDSDDYLVLSAIQELVDVAEERNVDVLKFSAYTFVEQENNLLWEKPGYKYDGDYPTVMTGNEFFRISECNQETYPSACLMMIKREHIKKNGIEFIRGILHEDNIYNWETVISAERVSLMNKPIYCSRIRNGSIMHSDNYDVRYTSFVDIIEYTRNKIDVDAGISVDMYSWFLRKQVSLAIGMWYKLNHKQKKDNIEVTNTLRNNISHFSSFMSKSAKLFYASPQLYSVFAMCLKMVEKVKRHE